MSGIYALASTVYNKTWALTLTDKILYGIVFILENFTSNSSAYNSYGRHDLLSLSKTETIFHIKLFGIEYKNELYATKQDIMILKDIFSNPYIDILSITYKLNGANICIDLRKRCIQGIIIKMSLQEKLELLTTYDTMHITNIIIIGLPELWDHKIEPFMGG